MLWFIAVLLVFGVVFGAIARAVVPGRHDMGVVQTWLLGVVGSLVGGFGGYVLFDIDTGDGAIQAAGVVGSIFGAVVTLIVFDKFVRRT